MWVPTTTRSKGSRRPSDVVSPAVNGSQLETEVCVGVLATAGEIVVEDLHGLIDPGLGDLVAAIFKVEDMIGTQWEPRK